MRDETYISTDSEFKSTKSETKCSHAMTVHATVK